MKKFKLIFFVAALIFSCQLALAQQLIRGKIVDNAQQPLVGASVVVKGTLRGTSTAVDGTFSIDANRNDLLIISYVGYNTREVQVGDQSTINITLQADERLLSEVVVTALGIER
jgi:hypothetical protein